MRKDNETLTALTTEITKLSEEVAKLRGERDAIRKDRNLEQERTRLREEIETLKIEVDRKDEENSRKIREVEHATGLHRKQSEWEREKAVGEAKLKVREENLSAEQKRFEQQMDFHKTQIKNEVDRMQALITGLLERLPTISVEKAIDLTYGGNGNKATSDA